MKSVTRCECLCQQNLIRDDEWSDGLAVFSVHEVSSRSKFRKLEIGGVSMNMKGIVVVALSFLLLNVPASLIAASSAAGKIITTGSAEVNGVAVPAVTSVFVGDRIATQK